MKTSNHTWESFGDIESFAVSELRVQKMHNLCQNNYNNPLSIPIQVNDKNSSITKSYSPPKFYKIFDNLLKKIYFFCILSF